MSRLSSRLPAFVPPQVPSLTALPPSGPGWLHEIKHDGYRTLIRIEHGNVRAFTRAGHDWTDKYQLIVGTCADLACRSAMLDGEIIVQDRHGASDFVALRQAIEKEPHRLVFFAFDLLFLDGADLRDCPLIERREKLREIIPAIPRLPIQFSDHCTGSGKALFKKACQMGLEGIVSKRAASRYRSGPSKTWLKAKNMGEGEFTLLGTDVDHDGRSFAYLGRWDTNVMRYAGTALLALGSDARADLEDRIARLGCGIPAIPVSSAGRARWIRPKLRVRVRYLNGGNQLRHATVRGLVE
jgi:bifunctional non-homologous end joining protein LigD